MAPSCSAPARRTAHLLDEALALPHMVSVRSKVALAFTVRGDLLPVPRSVRCRVYLPALRLQDCWRQLMASMAELERRDPVADEKWIRVHRSPDTTLSATAASTARMSAWLPFGTGEIGVGESCAPSLRCDKCPSRLTSRGRSAPTHTRWRARSSLSRRPPCEMYALRTITVVIYECVRWGNHAVSPTGEH